jgi:predicted nucleic acid-binding protein
MIFDSSVWINYSIGKINKETDLLDSSLARGIPSDMCPPILQEILQGIRSSFDYERTKDMLFEMNLLQLDPYFVAEGAANLYRNLRAKGVTIQKPNDCQIAFYAIHFKLKLVHNDKDYDKIAKHTSLKIYST